MPFPSLLDELAWRGMLHQQTDGLAGALASGVVRGYCGFDPTARSLHVGSLVPVMALVHLQRAGHVPVALVGGGTGMIGDPSGRTVERQLHAADVVDANTRALATQLGRFLDFEGPRAARMANNADWLGSLGALEFLRDVGKHFTVNYMLQKESVKTRLGSDGGISFTEFSYMLLQAYDFQELCRRDGVTLQIGGSDQWGNITAGTTLVRKVLGVDAHGLTVPLVTTASGTKFGKSEAGAVWLDAAMTSPYQFFQFWMNTDDRDLPSYLRLFTLLSRPEVEALERSAAANPGGRDAQRALAREVTTRVHGDAAATVAEHVSALLFGGSDPQLLSAPVLDALSLEVPAVTITRDEAVMGEGLGVLALLVASRLAASKGAARRLLEQGGVSVNGRRLASGEHQLGTGDLLPGGRVLLRKGAREYALVTLRA